MKKNHDVHRAARLLVLCARPGLETGDMAEVLGLLAPAPDWAALLQTADDEGILPLLYWGLRNRPDRVPPAVLGQLRVHYLRNLARNVRISKQAEPFFAAVRDSGLRVVLTKGLRLASTVYADIGLRPFWDLDLVVRPDDWPAIRKILHRQGFEEAQAGPPGRDAACLETGWVYSPYFRRGDLVLEFHFNVLGLHFPVGANGREGTTAPPMPLRGTEVLVYSPENELCYLCVHAQQHSYRKLIWLTDIAGMAVRNDLDWAGISAICDTMKIHAPVYHGLFLVNTLWPGTIPSGVLRSLRPPFPTRAALDFFWPAAAVAGRTNSLAWPYYMPSLFSLWERRSPGLGARTLSAIFFPPRPWLAGTCGLTANSPRLYYQYARRLSRPLGMAVRRLMSIP
jgi:hypothetical protein